MYAKKSEKNQYFAPILMNMFLHTSQMKLREKHLPKKNVPREKKLCY